MSYKASISHHIDVNIQNTSGIRILVSTDGADWSDEYSVSVDANLGDSDLIIATQKAVKAYIDAHHKWSENEYGIFHSNTVVIGGPATHTTNISNHALQVLGNIKATELSLGGDILFNEDKGLDWGGGDSAFYMGSDGMVHVLGMDGIYLKHANGTIATINSHGLGIGTAAASGSELSVIGAIVTDTAFKMLATNSNLTISTNTSASRHVISSTDFPIAILEEGEDGGGVVITKGAIFPWDDNYTNIGTSSNCFSEGYINKLNLKGNITSAKTTDTEISVSVADKNLQLKTATGTGNVKLNKTMSFQLTAMNGGRLDVGDSFEAIARQVVPPEMDGFQLKAAFISANGDTTSDTFNLRVTKQDGDVVAEPSETSLISTSHRPGVYNRVKDVSTDITAATTISVRDTLTVYASYNTSPTTKAEDVCLTLLFDF